MPRHHPGSETSAPVVRVKRDQEKVSVLDMPHVGQTRKFEDQARMTARATILNHCFGGRYFAA